MIDTSPAGVAEIRRNFGFWGEDDDEVILALLDALEAARHEIEENKFYIAVLLNELAELKIPAAAPPVGDDTHAAAHTGE